MAPGDLELGVAAGNRDAAAGRQAAAGFEHRLPDAVPDGGGEQRLDRAASWNLCSKNTRRDHSGVVENQAIAGSQKFRELRKVANLAITGCP